MATKARIAQLRKCTHDFANGFHPAFAAFETNLKKGISCLHFQMFCVSLKRYDTSIMKHKFINYIIKHLIFLLFWKLDGVCGYRYRYMNKAIILPMLLKWRLPILWLSKETFNAFDCINAFNVYYLVLSAVNE